MNTSGPRSVVPSLREERRLLRAGSLLVAGMDEVGRGALAGPVTVGVVLVDAGTRSAPVGLRDSKLLAPQAREALVPALRRWGAAWAVGHAEAAEIDAVGIIAALRLAGRRALAQLPRRPDVVLLDGSHDWLSPPGQPTLLDACAGEEPGPAVVTRVKADLACASVAAASVLAKTTRDEIMVRHALAEPRYGWDGNKGYSAPGHLAALAEHGPCDLHRRSWRLPGPRAAVPRAATVRAAAGETSGEGLGTGPARQA
ncbi:RNase HII [Kineococcus xinjiangensis]|uniref:Ribonuclease HII n=1 Tax=Kineococcus xinjiangensis TaxID=512762 RepID=A0A2S6IW21_9ACTN|nr:ribonuclease HII [Kineococcus xinjiangensis]PPK98523.1 RNase HII [Kineococcus xinjiangensis]